MGKQSKGPKCGHLNLVTGCQDCKKILDKWNKRLEEDGLSESVHPERKIWHQLDYVFAKTEYYSLMAQAFEREEFGSPIEKIVIELRCKGLLILEIVEFLRKKKRKKIDRATVRYTIRRFENKWKIRKWTLKQMHLKLHT